MSFDIAATVEEWSPVPSYEGVYQVSDLGRVMSLDRISNDGKRLQGRLLRPFVMPSGHIRVRLSVGNRQRTLKVHRLVLIAFFGQGAPDTEVLHIDGNPANNMVENLRWGTKSENVRDQVKHGVHPESRKTHCPQDHPYDLENTYRAPRSGHRRCRTCVREHQRAAYHLKVKSKRGQS